MFKVGDRVVWSPYKGHGTVMHGTVITSQSFRSFILWEDRIEAWAFNSALHLVEKKKHKFPALTYWK